MKKNIKIELINIRAVLIAAAILFGIMVGLIPVCYQAAETKPVYRPIDSSVNLYGCSEEQYIEFFSSYFDLTLTSGLESFFKLTYPLFFEADYSFIIKFDNGVPDAFFTLSVTESYYFRERESGGSCYLYPVSIADGSSNYLYSSYAYILSQDRCVVSSTSSIWLPASDTVLMIKGRLYDLNEVCSVPDNITTGRDFGTSFCISDFPIPGTQEDDDSVITDIGITSDMLPSFMDVLTANLEVLLPVGFVIVGIMISGSLIPRIVYKFL